MIWGDPIEVNGFRPAWLRDDDRIWMHWGRTDHWSGLNGERRKVENWDEQDWKQIDQFRLPADHFAYLAIAKGFEPWGGGDSAPGDWGEGGVLLRDGKIGIGEMWRHSNASNDIIGYKRKQTASDGDYVSVKRMTEAGAKSRWSGLAHIHTVAALRDLGLIREPTQAETIATKTGLTVDQVQSVLDEVNNGTR